MPTDAPEGFVPDEQTPAGFVADSKGADPLKTGEGMEHPVEPIPVPTGMRQETGARDEPHVKQQKAMLGPEEYAREAPARHADAMSQIGTEMMVPTMITGPESLTVPGLLRAARATVGAGAGSAILGSAGERIGGIAGPTGRKVGGIAGGLGGALLGGNLAAGMERMPATPIQSWRGQPGSIRPMPFGIQRFMPEWMVPKGDPGSITNPGPYMEIPMRVRGGRAMSMLPAPEAGNESVAGTRSLILTPSEARSEETMQRIAKKRASERGMQFAGGMTPREGRKIPRMPKAMNEPEWSGKRETVDLPEEEETEK